MINTRNQHWAVRLLADGEECFIVTAKSPNVLSSDKGKAYFCENFKFCQKALFRHINDEFQEEAENELPDMSAFISDKTRSRRHAYLGAPVSYDITNMGDELALERRVVIRSELNDLSTLLSKAGDECFIVTACVTDETPHLLGSIKGTGFVESKSLIVKTEFLQYLRRGDPTPIPEVVGSNAGDKT
ncbi:hypothetical protein MAR_014716 [Mya arenaria]|uniref:Uncharacterized protein n=1 Tax=Mya arenaria TaxID=6604 RepID=A0ABY7FI79_MYAAR|nr:hypothetical protein MAR_014716 [Mya arenaria]